MHPFNTPVFWSNLALPHRISATLPHRSHPTPVLLNHTQPPPHPQPPPIPTTLDPPHSAEPQTTSCYKPSPRPPRISVFSRCSSRSSSRSFVFSFSTPEHVMWIRLRKCFVPVAPNLSARRRRPENQCESRRFPLHVALFNLVAGITVIIIIGVAFIICVITLIIGLVHLKRCVFKTHACRYHY